MALVPATGFETVELVSEISAFGPGGGTSGLDQCCLQIHVALGTVQEGLNTAIPQKTVKAAVAELDVILMVLEKGRSWPTSSVVRHLEHNPVNALFVIPPIDFRRAVFVISGLAIGT